MKYLPKIEVKTLPNGYSLEFDGMKQKGYMYHNSEDLLKGFMVHIGMEITDQLNMETVDDFIVTAMNWKDNEKCIKEIERLTAALKTAERATDNAMKRFADKQDRVNGFVGKLTALAAKSGITKEVSALIKNYGIIGKPLMVEEENEEDV